MTLSVVFTFTLLLLLFIRAFIQLLFFRCIFLRLCLLLLRHLVCAIGRSGVLQLCVAAVPELIDLWGMNIQTTVPERKN